MSPTGEMPNDEIRMSKEIQNLNIESRPSVPRCRLRCRIVRHSSLVIRHFNCGGWNRTNGLLDQSQVLRTSSNRPAVFINQTEPRDCRKVRGEGFEPPSPASKAGSLPLADPRECPAGIEPACPAWKAGAFAARPRARRSSQRKERELNPQGSSLGGFRDRCHRQLACPS